ncbi:hypothetical protein D3C72_2218670 [compost metagenome]
MVRPCLRSVAVTSAWFSARSSPVKVLPLRSLPSHSKMYWVGALRPFPDFARDCAAVRAAPAGARVAMILTPDVNDVCSTSCIYVVPCVSD